MSTFAQRFKELRNKKSLTLKDLGEQLGYSESNLSMYESGQREPKSTEDLKKIANYFGCTVDYLIGNDHLNITVELNDRQLDEIANKVIEKFIARMK